MLHENLKLTIEDRLTEQLGTVCHIHQALSVGGGSINTVYRLETTCGRFFLKVNSAVQYPGMFEAEEKGLEFLRLPGALVVPEVIVVGSDGQTAFLIMEYIPNKKPEAGFWEDFGRSVAMLHRFQGNHFGLEHSNYIGSLVQHNKPHDDWVSFFRSMRLVPLVKMAMDQNKMDAQTAGKFEGLYRKLSEIFPRERPAMLHGDLWSGNYLCTSENKPCIVDPAIYYGCREMDIAMTQLFGGYNKSFYHAYNEIHPLPPGWQERIDICNLYPLLVHVNLFGGGYINTVQRIVDKF